jgi:hypothetical protein
MSDNDTTENGDTHDAVRQATNDANGGVSNVSMAADASMAKAAPADEILQFIAEARQRISALEAQVNGVLPQVQAVYDAVKTPVEMAIPASRPVVATIDAIIDAIHEAFGKDRISLPPKIGG